MVFAKGNNWGFFVSITRAIHVYK